MSKITATYNALVKSQQITDDGMQRELLTYLESLRRELIKKQRFIWRWLPTKNITRGIYFWGSVGTGKTFLMDLFFESLPFENKTRIHFHQFMKKVQTSLAKLQGQESPLERIAKEWSAKTSILCFDEFHVSDIADAMILERLFHALFRHGVVLVATSNIPPDNLYLEGLHRKRFLPAIALIKKHCQVFHLDSKKDYRREFFDKEGVYFYPLNRKNQRKMQHWFDLFATGNIKKNGELTIESRQIATVKASDKVVWFEFSQLCAPPRSYVDYLALSKQYQTILVSGVPVIAEHDLASITYLIHLVDVLYDARIRLILMADDIPEKLYVKGKKLFEFQRCLSRLEEMRSKEYAQSLSQSAFSR